MQIAPPEFHFARHAVREDLRAASLDALIVTSLPNLAYLTGLYPAAAGAAIVSPSASRCLSMAATWPRRKRGSKCSTALIW